MNPINNLSNDPFDNDTMDPNDPNSIMYDPTIAESGKTVTFDDNSDSNDDVSNVNKNIDTQNTTSIDNTCQDNEIAKKLRRFGKEKV